MNIKLSVLVLAAGISSLFSSCDNEIELDAPYKEIGVVYGLINPADDTLFVRIQKAFLGPGNANQMAQIADSIYYPDILNVEMQRIQNGNVTSSFPLTRFEGPPKEPGEFPTTPNILYKSNGENIFKDSDYRIVVKNSKTGYQCSATTPIVDSLRIIRPNRSANSFVQFSSDDFPYVVDYYTGLNGKVFAMTIRFWYYEEETGSGIPGTNKYIDWVFPNTVVSDPNNSENIRINIEGEDFYKFVGDKIPVNPAVFRNAGHLDFTFISGAEILANYININSATTSVLTSTPYYSNVDNGTGIFSSRFIQVIPNKQLDGPSKSLLLTSPYTSDLGFQ